MFIHFFNLLLDILESRHAAVQLREGVGDGGRQGNGVEGRKIRSRDLGSCNVAEGIDLVDAVDGALDGRVRTANITLDRGC